MNTPTTTLVKHFTNLTRALNRADSLFKVGLLIKIVSLILSATVITKAAAEWKIDLSRRSQSTRTQDLRDGADDATIQIEPNNKKNFFESLFEAGQIAQEIVVLNTERGFVPSTLRLKKGLAYQIHIVNVNDKEKNVSFVLDSFSEHHATFYGKIKSFTIQPQKEGVYKFVSPETSAQGKVVVFTGEAPELRAPASGE